MTTTVIFVLPGRSVGKSRPRFGGGRVYTPAKTRAAERGAGWFARQAMEDRGIITGAVVMEIDIGVAIPISWPANRRGVARAGGYPAIGKPDVDNVAKLILDACNGIVWQDDSQVVELRLAKWYSMTPATAVVINEVPTRCLPYHR